MSTFDGGRPEHGDTVPRFDAIRVLALEDRDRVAAKGSQIGLHGPGGNAGGGYNKTATGAVSEAWKDVPGVTLGEIVDWPQRGGYLRSVVVESEPSDTHKTRYSLFLLTSWRPGYHILHVNWPARPRLFKDFERLQALIRHEFRYEDTIAVRLPNIGQKKRRSHFRER